MFKTETQTKTAGWIRDLASHYDRARTIYPDDRLIILFDVDGTIVDLESFLKAALLLPTSLTADFDSPSWPYRTALA